MPGVRGLTIIVLTADPDRFAGALTLAAANAALGGRTRLYAHEKAVALLARDGGHDALLAAARELSVTLIACQTGLAIAGLAHADLIEGVETGGLVSLLADLGDDRLVTV